MDNEKVSLTRKDYVEDRTGYRFVPSLKKLAEAMSKDERWPKDMYEYLELSKNVSCVHINCLRFSVVLLAYTGRDGKDMIALSETPSSLPAIVPSGQVISLRIQDTKDYIPSLIIGTDSNHSILIFPETNPALKTLNGFNVWRWGGHDIGSL